MCYRDFAASLAIPFKLGLLVGKVCSGDQWQWDDYANNDDDGVDDDDNVREICIIMTVTITTVMKSYFFFFYLSTFV